MSKAVAPERPAFAHPAFDYENRIVTVDLPALTVASVYVPNGGKDFDAKMRFLGALEEFARTLQEQARQVVICGDLNIARTDMDVHPKERKPRIIGQLPEERALLERIIGHGLVDTGRALEPENDQMFTWWAPWRNMRQRNIGWRLDYLLATRSVFERVSRCTVQRDFGTSDHAPVVAEYEIAGGPGAARGQASSGASATSTARLPGQPVLGGREKAERLLGTSKLTRCLLNTKYLVDMNKPHPTLTPQELAIMKIVWQLEKATVRDVYEAQREHRDVAYTTVMTMMKILEEKKFLKKTQVDRAYEYRPAKPAQQVVGAMVRDFLDRVFDGAAGPLLVHLAKDAKLSKSDKDAMRRLMEEMEE